MSFAERFNGRTSFMNKEGVTGIVAQKSAPIDKTPGTSQVNYFTPSNQFSGAGEDRARITNHQARSDPQGSTYQKMHLMTPQHNSAYQSSFNDLNSDFTHAQRAMIRTDQTLSIRSPQQRSKSNHISEESQQNAQGFSYSKPPMPKRSPGEQPQNQYSNAKNKRPEVIPKQSMDGSHYQSLQLPPKMIQQPYIAAPSSKNYIVQQNILSNTNHVEFGMRYQHNNANADRYKQYQYHNGQQNEMMARHPQEYQQMDMQLEQRQMQLPEYFPNGVVVGDDGNYYQQVKRPQLYQMQGMDPYQAMQGTYSSDNMQGNMNEGYSDQGYSNGDMHPKSESKQFKPYTMKDYKTIQSQGSARRGGLGPNTYSQDWVKKKEKTDKMNVYAELVRISNTKNVQGNQMRKPQTEENKVKPMRQSSNPRGNPNNYNYDSYDVENEGYMQGKQLGRQERQQLQFLNKVDLL